MTTDIPSRPSALARGGPWAWRGADFVVAAVFGIAMGVVFIAWDYLLNTPWTAITLAFPPAASLALGVWLLPAIGGGLIVRRPGAALFVELVAAILEYLLGNPWGPGVLVSGLLQGLGVELVLAAFRWRRFGPAVAMLAGAASATVEIVVYEWWSYAAEYSWPWKLAMLAFAVVSGLAAGLAGHALVRALARTGALSGFPPGAEETLRRAGDG
ncbi:ECF transporter S component [Propionicicella superfundia]|uniref:ECF transporter S component n=1 Tax=Propionicicella superfundia TaxID=348582 RepID=UPI0003FC558E|nr:ECF transporter S component [Propionicicella superfundia]